MTRNTVLVSAFVLATLAACGKQEEAPPAAPVPAVPQAVPVAPAPAPQAPGDSCSKDCGGSVVSIQCAEGEMPVCECAPAPAASCKVPPASGSP